MINKLYQDITVGLKKIKPCTIYQEDVPQRFKKPSFLLTFYDQNPSRGINGRLKNTVRVDVLYFPEDEDNYNSECWALSQNLTRELQLEDFKIRNRNLKITDKVLHFMFDVDYREYRNTDETKMQKLSQNADIKEE